MHIAAFDLRKIAVQQVIRACQKVTSNSPPEQLQARRSAASDYLAAARDDSSSGLLDRPDTPGSTAASDSAARAAQRHIAESNRRYAWNWRLLTNCMRWHLATDHRPGSGCVPAFPTDRAWQRLYAVQNKLGANVLMSKGDEAGEPVRINEYPTINLSGKE